MHRLKKNWPIGPEPSQRRMQPTQKKIVADLAAKIVVGNIIVKWLPVANKLTITLTANVPEIEVTDKYKTSASMKVTFIFDNQNKELTSQMQTLGVYALGGTIVLGAVACIIGAIGIELLIGSAALLLIGIKSVLDKVTQK